MSPRLRFPAFLARTVVNRTDAVVLMFGLRLSFGLRLGQRDQGAAELSKIGRIPPLATDSDISLFH